MRRVRAVFVIVSVLGVCGCHSHSGAGHSADAATPDARLPVDAAPPDAAPVTPPCAGHVGFPGLPAVPVGASPGSIELVATADLNGDGKLDLVVIRDLASLSVLLGKGDGTFGAPTDYTVNENIHSVGIADLNGDGKPDVAVVNGQNQTLGVFLNQGGGTLAPQVTYPASGDLEYLALGDFDGDGDLDAAMVGANGLAILTNNGSGAFGAPTYYASGGYGVAVGDVNADGKADVVVSNGNAMVYINKGDGSLEPPVSYATAGARGPVALGDMNGDGKLDLVVAAGDAAGGAISVLANNGDGTFATHSDYSTAGNQERLLALADVNGDGRLDVITDDLNGGAIKVLLGTATGLAPAVNHVAMPYALAVGDVDGDGNVDLLSAGQGVQILRGDGHGAFQEFAWTPSTEGTIDLVIGDLDRDGKVDVVTSTFDGVIERFGAGDGTFPTSTSYLPDDHPAWLALRDLDGDGWLDLGVVSGRAEGAEILPGDGTGKFGAPSTYATGQDPDSIAIGDLDRDGNADLVVADDNGQMISVLHGNGDRTFAAPMNFPATYPSHAQLADVNGDGWPDVLAAAGGVLQVLLNKGDGTLASPVLHGGVGAALLIADVNRDGKPDAVSPMSVSLGNGDGTFGSPIPFSGYGGGNASVAVADLDGDQNPDVVLGAGQVVYVLYGHGDGTFEQPVWYATAGVGAVKIVDVDGDGRPDIVTGGTFGISVLYNRCVP